jgi:hypothetical protein
MEYAFEMAEKRLLAFGSEGWRSGWWDLERA